MEDPSASETLGARPGLMGGTDMMPRVVGATEWPKVSLAQDWRLYSHSLLTKRSSTRLCFCRDLGTGPGCTPPSAGTERGKVKAG